MSENSDQDWVEIQRRLRMAQHVKDTLAARKRREIWRETFLQGLVLLVVVATVALLSNAIMFLTGGY